MSSKKNSVVRDAVIGFAAQAVVEQLEGRQLLSGSLPQVLIDSQPLSDRWVRDGQSGVVVADLDASLARRSGLTAARFGGLTIVPTDGSAPFSDNVNRVRVVLDRNNNGRVDGNDQFIGSGVPAKDGESVSITFQKKRRPLISKQVTPHLLVIADFGRLQGGDVGFELADANVIAPSGRGIPDARVWIGGADPATIYLDQSRQTSIDVQQQPTQWDRTALVGQQVNLMQWTVSASKAVTLQNMTFTPVAGEIADMASYVITADLNGDGDFSDYQTSGWGYDSEQVLWMGFENLIVPGGTTITMKLMGTVTDGAVGSEVQFGFMDDHVVYATDGNGRQLDGNVRVSANLEYSPMYRPQQTGGLYVWAGPTGQMDVTLVPGQESAPMMQIYMHVWSESALVTAFPVILNGSGAKNVSQVLVYREGDSVPLAIAPVGWNDQLGQSAWISIPDGLFVPTHDSVSLFVTVKVIDGDAVNGDTVELELDRSSDFFAQGTVSNRRYVVSDSDTGDSGVVFSSLVSTGNIGTISAPLQPATLRIERDTETNLKSLQIPLGTLSEPIYSFLAGGVFSDRELTFENGDVLSKNG